MSGKRKRRNRKREKEGEDEVEEDAKCVKSGKRLEEEDRMTRT